MNDWLNTLSQALTTNVWLGPLIALVAGVLTSLMPCSLSSIPLVIGYVSGSAGANADRRKPLKLSLVFALPVITVALLLLTEDEHRHVAVCLRDSQQIFEIVNVILKILPE